MAGTHFPSGFRGGVEILRMPVLNTYAGDVYWVDSTTGKNGNEGTRERPFKTLGYAIGRCRANKGDMIIVMPNHSETITGVAGLDFDVAGITVMGMGFGGNKPTFLMDGAATVTAEVAAANVTISGLRFSAGHADIVAGVVVAAADCWLDDLEFVQNVANENFLSEIKVVSTTDNVADGLKVTNCRASSVDTAGLEFIEINGDLDRLFCVGNTVMKDAATSCGLVVCATGKDLTNCQIEGNRVISGATDGDVLIDNDTTANSGIVAFNLVGSHDVAAAGTLPIDLTGARLFENYQLGVDDAQGLLFPAADGNT